MAKFQFTKEEFVSGCFWLQRKRRRIAIAICAIGAFIISWQVERPQLALLGIVIPGLFLVIFYWSQRRTFSRVYHQQESFQSEIEVTLDDQDFRVSSKQGSAILPWNRVLKWSESSEMFFLYESDLLARMLPKRALSESEAALIRKHTEGVKRV